MTEKQEQTVVTLDDLKRMMELPKPAPISVLPQALESFSEEQVVRDIQSVVETIESIRISYGHLSTNYQFREQYSQDDKKIEAAIAKKEAEDKVSLPLAQSLNIYLLTSRFVGRRVNGAEFVNHRIAEQLTPDEKTKLDGRARESSEDVLYGVAMAYLLPDKYNHVALITLLLSGRFEQELNHLANLIEQLPSSLTEEYKEVLSKVIEIQERGGTIRFPNDGVTHSAYIVHMLPGGNIESIENREFENNLIKGKTSRELVIDSFAVQA